MNNKPKLIWLNVVVFTSTAVATLIGVPIYAFTHGFDAWQITALIVGIGFCEISITAGYHRLWSHKAYEANSLVRFVFMIGGTFATQNSILHWASDHRRHHRHVDHPEQDPYSAKRGFWYSHMGWMLRNYEVNPDLEYSNCDDLKDDSIVMWQHRHYMPLVLGVNFGIPIIFGLLHGDLLGMVLLLGFARLFVSHHFTFLINSLAHIWGSQPYSDLNSSKDNGFLAVLTMGEGYHNYHHEFQRDYRNGIRWWQFDPSKWLINLLAKLRLAENLHRTPLARIESARARMLLANTRRRLADLPHAEELVAKLQEEYDILMQKVDDFTRAQKRWLQANKSTAIETIDFDGLRHKMDELRLIFLAQKKQWLRINSSIA